MYVHSPVNSSKRRGNVIIFKFTQSILVLLNKSLPSRETILPQPNKQVSPAPNQSGGMKIFELIITQIFKINDTKVQITTDKYQKTYTKKYHTQTAENQ